jgi:anti-sigma regulatory factor (Ser/Thr protein kinase)
VRELSLHILDILQNSIEAGARHLEVDITESTSANRFIINITDDGRGMDEQTVKQVMDPFFTTRTTRQVGLGIPLFRAAARLCNGDLTITSAPGAGTRVHAEFQRDHIDRAPLGDIKSTLISVILANQTCDLRYSHRLDDRCFEFDTAEMRKILGEIQLSEPPVRIWLDEYLQQGLEQLYETDQAQFPLGER